jgi:hypothetical protein
VNGDPSANGILGAQTPKLFHNDWRWFYCSLSAERRGRFICTTAFCLSLWKPLVVPHGTKPVGIRSLTVVKRPDGKRQVAYRGAPLYRFVQDQKPGQIKGNGFRDVGIWRPVVVGKRMANAPASSSSRYGY